MTSKADLEEARDHAWWEVLGPIVTEVGRRVRAVLKPENYAEKICLARVIMAITRQLQYRARILDASKAARPPCSVDSERLAIQLSRFDPLTFSYKTLFNLGPNVLERAEAMLQRARQPDQAALPGLETPLYRTEGVTVPKHEVKVVWLAVEKLEEEANKLGANGWELFQTDRENQHAQFAGVIKGYLCIFKRVKTA